MAEDINKNANNNESPAREPVSDDGIMKDTLGESPSNDSHKEHKNAEQAPVTDAYYTDENKPDSNKKESDLIVSEEKTGIPTVVDVSTEEKRTEPDSSKYAKVSEPEKPNAPTGSKLDRARKIKEQKRKRKRKLIIIIVIMLVLAGAAVCASLYMKHQTEIKGMMVQTTAIEKQDLRVTVNTTGTVTGIESEKIYSTDGLTIEKVYVKAGDRVEAGDVLCEFDTTDLETSLKIKEITVENTDKSSKLKLDQTKDQYENAKKTLQSNLNTTLLSAQTNVDSAKRSLDDANTAYLNAQNQLDWNENTTLTNAENAVATAQTNLEKAQRDLLTYQQNLSTGSDSTIMSAENTLATAQTNFFTAQMNFQSAVDALNLAQIKRDSIYDNDESTNEARSSADISVADAQRAVAKSQLALNTAQDAVTDAERTMNTTRTSSSTKETELKESLESAQRAYDNAVLALESTKTTVGINMDTYLLNIEKAQDAYDKALQSQAAAQRTVKLELENYENNIATTELSVNTETSHIELDQMRAKLGRKQLKAPISGTITEVAAKEGGVGSGQLFAIENLDELKITTSIKEYDVVNVRQGMKVVITTDMTGDKEFSGRVQRISPVADIVTAASSDIKYPTDIEMLTGNTGLLKGMSTRLKIVTDEREDVYAVSSEAIVTSPDGGSMVYTVVPSDTEKNAFVVKAVPVTLGIETDFYVEITSSALTPEDIIISVTDGITEGMFVTPMGADMQTLPFFNL